MNYQLLLAATLVTVAALLSGELFRRGNNSWPLFWLTVALAVVGYLIAEVRP